MQLTLRVAIGDLAPSKRIRTPKRLPCRDAVLAISPQIREYLPQELASVPNLRLPVQYPFHPPSLVSNNQLPPIYKAH